MAYFNYHAKAKKLIQEGYLIKYEIVQRYNNVAPALVLYFSNNRPIPIREYKWNEYFDLIKKTNKKNCDFE